MSIFGVSSAKAEDLRRRMERLGIREADLEEQFVRSGGAGGQNVNKVSTCVVLAHRPTGETVKCQLARSQGLNRFLARRILVDRLEARAAGQKSAERARIEKIRRQKRRRSRRAKNQMLEGKHRQSDKKAMRRAPSFGD